MIRDALADLADGRSLGFAGARSAVGEIMDGLATPAQIGGFLMGFRMKGEGPDEIAGMATAMRERCAAIRPPDNGRIVDLCGTGGARITTFNVSTIAMFVVAAAGVVVAKHGNRAITSRCGSADLLESLGARIDLEPPQVERILQTHGFCFMFAPKFHPAMKQPMWLWRSSEGSVGRSGICCSRMRPPASTWAARLPPWRKRSPSPRRRLIPGKPSNYCERS